MSENNEDETPQAWDDSEAKEYLYSLIVDNKIPGKDDIKPKQVYLQFCKDRAEFKCFQDYTALGFAAKLSHLRDKAEKREGRAERDATSLAHDRQIFPAPTEGTDGNALWQKSKAQELLKQDIAKGKNKKMKPKDLFETRPEYCNNFTLDFFRERIHQEIRAEKHRKHMKDKAKKKAEKEAKAKRKKATK